jgi:sugar phosphate isomerase/epimerase
MIRNDEFNRREFLTATAATLATRLAHVSAQVPPAANVGLQLVTVREAVASALDATLARVRGLGIEIVEPVWWLFGPDKPAAELNRSLRAAGLRAPSSHVRTEVLTTTLPQRLEEARVLGHSDLVCVTIPAEQRRTIDDWRRWADVFNKAGEQSKTAGVALSFHAHPYDFDVLDGQVPLDVFLERTVPDLVGLQMDVSHFVRAGKSPAAYLQKFNAFIPYSRLGFASEQRHGRGRQWPCAVL